MSIQWSFGARKPASPLVAAFVSTIARTSPTPSATKHQAMRKSRRLVPVPTNAFAARNATSTSPKHNWFRNNSAPGRQATTSQKRFQSTSSNNGNGRHGNSQQPRGRSNAFTTLSTLTNIFAAGTGTFASTLIALYLATVVETSAHEFLYEYFPHWYYEVREEDLPICLMGREVARRVTGLVESNRARGVGEGRDSYLMSIDGWMEAASTADVASSELLAEADFERRRGGAMASSDWQRRMTEKRENIIKQEEQAFSLGFVSSPAETSFQRKSQNNHKNSGVFEIETKKIQQEAARKLQERLMSVAMTA
mmetsp:Transcript_21985/g.53211  ORF Transcript_21985/g.53211 Transcript_21985/m.53211 type:complete len:309 (+) Transcript_21985:87-1013(+)